MAWAQYDPITQARVDRQKALDAAANSPDPVERWRAKERMLYDGFVEMSNGLIKQAIKNGKERAALEKEYDRLDNGTYKPLHR